ncbi:MAG: hypothetical protein J5563_07445 [Clostridia bacterium]|nr:hypothetical protein [Clostridia bacterium]
MKTKVCAVVFAAMLLVSCGHGAEPGPGGTATAGREEKTVEFADTVSFRIVIPKECSDDVKASAAGIASALECAGGDGAVFTDGEAEQEKEILVGNVRRAETTGRRSEIRKIRQGRWYHIGVSGDKIMILGSDDDTLFCGARYFASRILSGAVKGQTVMIPENATFECGPQAPCAVSINEKGAESTFVAEVNIGEAPWYADVTGRQDMTSVLKKALSHVRSAGGGIVFLPAGIYKVTEPLTVDTAVTLRGVYADPDTQSLSEGTTLLFSLHGAKKLKDAVILEPNAALQGITVMYDDQDGATRYGFSVKGNGNAFTVRDCNFINSWDGISSGQKPVGMVTVDNVRGTVLHTGIETEQHADICVTTDVLFSPSYWAANGGPGEDKIREIMSANGSVGIYAGDVDRDTFENITLDGFAVGIYSRSPTRAGFSASFYNLNILNSGTGIEARGLSAAYGICIAGGRIEATQKAVSNLSSGAQSVVNTANVVIEGKTEGRINAIYGESLPDAGTAGRNSVSHAPARLFSITDYGADKSGRKDISAALQKALDDAANNGGGIVYIPAGLYLLEKPVTGGENVCVQGACPNAQGATPDFSGSVMLVTHGRGFGEDGRAAITLNGGSGVTGITVYYPENGIYNDMPGKKVLSYSPFLRCTGSKCYFTYSCLIACSRAVAFENADGFTADRLTGTFYDCGVSAKNCRGGLISRIHTNGTYLSGEKKDRSVLGENWFSDTARLYEAVIDGVLAKRLVQVSAEGCGGLTVSHTFYYGGLNLISAEDSEIKAVCCEGARTTTETFVLKGGCSLKAVICNRPNGNDYIRKTGSGNAAYIIMFNNSLTVYSGKA